MVPLPGPPMDFFLGLPGFFKVLHVTPKSSVGIITVFQWVFQATSKRPIDALSYN